MVGFVGESFEKRQWESEQFHLGWMYEIVGTYWDKSRRKAGLFPSFLRYLRCQWIRTSWHWPAAMTRPRRPHQQTLVSWSVWLGKLPVCHRISLHSAWFMNDVLSLRKKIRMNDTNIPHPIFCLLMGEKEETAKTDAVKTPEPRFSFRCGAQGKLWTRKKRMSEERYERSPIKHPNTLKAFESIS